MSRIAQIASPEQCPRAINSDQRLGAAILERDAGGPQVQGSLDEPGQGVCGLVWRQPVGPHVGNAVALCIGAARLRIISQIKAQAIARRKSRPFADQNGDETGAENLADLIAERNARPLCEHNGSQRQPESRGMWQERLDHGDRIQRNGCRRQPIAHHESQIARITATECRELFP